MNYQSITLATETVRHGNQPVIITNEPKGELVNGYMNRTYIRSSNLIRLGLTRI